MRFVLLVLILSLWAVAPSAQPAEPEAPHGVPHQMTETISSWRQLEVAVFTSPVGEADGFLLRGLKALVDGDLEKADLELASALESAPDSLRPFIRARLAESAREQFRWGDALQYTLVDRPEMATDTQAGYARFPTPALALDAPETTVPFEGLRIPLSVNGAPARAIVDTGAPGTGIGRALVERLGLRVDTTAKGRSSIPSMGLSFDTYAVLIDSIQIGDATLYNVPATVGWTEEDASKEDDEIFLGANILRHLLDGLRYDYADSTFTLIRDIEATDEAPMFIIDSGSAPVLPVSVDGVSANAIIDTGNLASVYLASGAFDLTEATFSRAISGVTESGYEWSQQLYHVPFEIPGHPSGEHEAYEATFVFQKDDPITVILGKPIWQNGALMLDFVNRRVAFTPSGSNR
ncbi:MAG: retropepsin-like aspartic protease [Bacteroidota bacterium]